MEDEHACVVRVLIDETDDPNNLNIKFEHVSGDSRLMAAFATMTMRGANSIEGVEIEQY